MNEKNEKIMVWTILGLFAVVMLTLVLLPRQISISTPGAEQGISVSGQAEQEVMPDKAILWLSVVTEGQTASTTQDQNTAAMNAVKKALEEVGIGKKYIETKSYNLYPLDEWDSELQKSVRRGYRLTHTIVVTTNDIARVGELLDVAVKSGVNEVGNIQFTLSDETERELKEELTALATARAREKAKLLAEGLDVFLGRVISISQTDYAPPVYYGRYDLAEANVLAQEAPDISPEQVTVRLTVNALFEIR